MRPRLALGLGVLGLFAVFGAGPAVAQVDFSIRVTDNNRVGITTSNYGFYGNDYVSRAPSFEYPLGTGFEHMVRGGLWIGALALTDTGEVIRVSTGALDAFQGNGGPASTEFLPTSVIVERSRLPNSRFFHPDAVSEQDYISGFTDDPGRTPRLASERPHVPIGVDVKQEMYNWSFAAFADLVIAHLTIKPTKNLVRDMYVGMFAEMASGPKNQYSTWPPSSTGGGSLGSWYNKKLLRWDAERRLIAEHYCLDSSAGEGGCNFDVVPPWIGIKLLGVRPDTIANKIVGLKIWNFAPGDNSRDEDVELYDLLSSPHQTPPDSLPPLMQTNDPVELLSTGPFDLLVGDSIQVDFAFVGGETYEEMLEAADFAQLAFDFNYVVPSPPPSPRMKLVARHNEVDILWDDSPESVVDETSPQPGGMDFEGYRVYLGTDRNELDLVAQFDVPDTAGFNTGFDAIRLAQPVVIDGDTMHYRYRVTGVRDGFKQFAAVTSFDTGDMQITSLESGISQNKSLVIPGAQRENFEDRGVTVFPNPYKVQARWDAGTLVRDHYLWFANLPERCKITIFTLSGDKVFETEFDGDTYTGTNARGVFDATRELDVPPPTLSGHMFAWNMITREGQAAATGLYLWTVQDRERGTTERGKFLIIKSDREGFQ